MAIVQTDGQYSRNWMDAATKSGWFPLGFAKAGSLGRALLRNDMQTYSRDRMIQEEEFNTLKNRVKTVNYGSAITNPSDVSGNVATTEEQQIAAALALEEEEELLGQRNSTLGSTSLLKGLK